MTLMGWLRGESLQNQAPKTRPTHTENDARLPEQPFIIGQGTLDPRSPTWLFIQAWAGETLQKAREKNDSATCDSIKTAVLRGEIKILKELINLPNPKSSRGLLDVEE